jgi:hypothetical protein
MILNSRQPIKSVLLLHSVEEKNSYQLPTKNPVIDKNMNNIELYSYRHSFITALTDVYSHKL